MKTVQVQNVRIGEGIPKVIVPIVKRTRQEILRAAEELLHFSFDMVEWRADHYEDVTELASVRETAAALRQILGDKPILFTFRTAGEGGEREITPQEYEALNKEVIAAGAVDLIDVEAFFDEAVVRELIDFAHRHQVKVIASNHDFFKTPSEEEILRRLLKMQELGADIPKIAVMPNGKEDVLTLLSATQKMTETLADRPIITMSMAKTGMISRLAGEIFGSACTFGAAGETSAPGQMNVTDLKTVLQVLHRSMGE